MIETGHGSGGRLAFYAIAGIIVLSLPAATKSAESPMDDTARIVKAIDQHIADGWQANGVRPGTAADDSEFLRRTSLDLIGRIPTVAESRTFLDNRDPNKRRQLIDQLTSSPRFASHMATVLRRMWIPQTDTQEFNRLIVEYETWLSRRIRQRTPYDELVRQQLVVPVGGMAVPINPDGDRTGSSAFVAVADLKPELLAANTARAFLGINIDCAQCHDHPFARWSREQFWETAAFFARPDTEHTSAGAPLTIAVGDTEMRVEAVLLTDGGLQWPGEKRNGTGRALLAGWMTGADNPFFARNAVNRTWANFLGTGFIEPLDDLSGAVPASHPELLDELSRSFIASGFDLRFLVRCIVQSRAYQLSSVPPLGVSAAEDPQFFASMPTRALTGEQLYDSLRTAACLPAAETVYRSGYRQHPREQFAAQFLVPRPSQGQRSLVQALTLMNGQLAADVTAATQSPLLVAIADAPFLSDEDRVETLFLAAYARFPTQSELQQFLRYLQHNHNRTAALSDLLWVLLNSSEFNTNH